MVTDQLETVVMFHFTWQPFYYFLFISYFILFCNSFAWIVLDKRGTTVLIWIHHRKLYDIKSVTKIILLFACFVFLPSWFYHLKGNWICHLFVLCSDKRRTEGGTGVWDASFHWGPGCSWCHGGGLEPSRVWGVCLAAALDRLLKL